MGFSLQIPVTGQPHSTEDVKVGNDLTTLQTWGNGNIADTDLNSPTNGRRVALLQATGFISSAFLAGDYILIGNSMIGAHVPLPTLGPVPVWAGDAGYSGQPQNFAVPHKTAYGRVAFNLTTNSVAPGVTITAGLYRIIGVGGNSGQIWFDFTTPVAGSTIAVASPAANGATIATSPQFSLPTDGTVYALGANLSGSPAAGNVTMLNEQLLYYNA